MTAPPKAPSTPPRLIVIDGPAGAGKSTVARRLAEHFGLPLLDTGAIYRTLALVALRRPIALDDGAALGRLTVDLPIAFRSGRGPDGALIQQVLLAEEDVSEAIRTPQLSEAASRVSQHPEVRAGLLELQRALAAGGCVAEGRDMGTVVFPAARDKFFLTASLEARAQRRHAELAEATGADLGDVRREVAERDQRDRSRAAAPLVQAADAVVLDSSHLDIAEVVRRIISIIEAREASLAASEATSGASEGAGQEAGEVGRDPAAPRA
ncbi:MAG: (d)CMP kinase [Myxococcales bacterium]|nr:(d)CMP kinase [Myxococcales bacterium]MCB9702016.1 (d)CMP kinase [Myxococcales bacterium]